jgi:predicted TIM-barrel fold metal-dependent hydrolase
MTVIDSDAHVIENEHTWDYMTAAEREHRPQVIMAPGPDGRDIEWWIVDGRRRGKQTNIGLDTPEASREMQNVALRLKHMDELGVDLQVLYPSIFLSPLTDRPEVELALCRSYNRWMADIWAHGQHRLRWAAVLPLMTMDASLAELDWAREQGACAVFIRGLEGERRLTDPYFFPLYEGDSGFARFKLPNVAAFHALLFHRIPDKFPKLRFGFIEIAAQWVPYAIHDLARRLERRGDPLGPNPLGDNRIWVACQTDDDLPYVLQYAGENNLVIGSDYGHADTATEIEALRRLKENDAINPRTVDKILDDNARALYGL